MYEVKKVDLTAVFNAQKVVDAQRDISEFFILDIPAGASFLLRIGASAEYLTVTRPFSMEPRGDALANAGIYISNPVAQPGVVIELVVVYGAGQLSAVLT